MTKWNDHSPLNTAVSTQQHIQHNVIVLLTHKLNLMTDTLRP